jgi:uncharacterized protein
MALMSKISRRDFVCSSALLAVGLATTRPRATAPLPTGAIAQQPLAEFAYGHVTLASELHNRQLEETQSVLMELSEDSLMKPFRQMAGQPAPGEELGGWYHYDPSYDWHKFDVGFAPGATFGQWVSALARAYAINGDSKVRDKVFHLNALCAKEISAGFFEKNRFPGYCYDKLVCGLIDSHRWAGDPDAYHILEHVTDTALPHLPVKAIEHGQSWRTGTDESYTWDESYTMPENLFLAYRQGAGDRYRTLGSAYLDDTYFDPLAENRSDLAGRHAYSHVNALCSAMQAYLTLGSRKHLLAATNGFNFLAAQSYATGGWGPDEKLRAPNSPDLANSLYRTHNSFETPCGSYAHFKLTRYLLRVTRDPRYGDSMERVMYNTVLGAEPMHPDGRAFYYSDYNFAAHKVYSNHRWPCCSGTLPQVAADYRISTYFADPRGIYVNLYIPSAVRWSQGGAQVGLAQKTEYPLDSSIELEITPSQPTEFTVNLRIPAWATGASVSVNGKRIADPVVPGSFAAARRTWKANDRIEVDLPLVKRLEPISAAQPQTVALLSGPLVLFPITAEAPVPTAQQLLSAKKLAQAAWRVETAQGPLGMLPFTAISDEQYSTYMNLVP